MSLLDAKPIYKPFHYPWAYDAWLTQQRIHWLPEEVPLADDVKDWRNKLSDSERHLLTQIFRFFTQADVEVNNCYMRHYSRVIKPTEVQMMLAAFSAMETVHVAAYSHLLDTIGMPETEYSAFLTVKEMKDKYDFMKRFRHVVVSGRIGMVKPDPRIYAHLLEQAQQKAEHCVFIDDNAKNAEAATALGWHGITHRSGAETASRLRDLGVAF